MPYNNIHTLSSEQRRQFFLELFDTDPSLLNALNHEQHRRLYSVLIAINPSFMEPLLDARSTVRDMINKQHNSSTNNIVNFDSALDQSDAEETDNAHNSLSDDDNNSTYELLIVGYTLLLKRRNVKPRKCSNNINNVNIESATNQSDTDNAHNYLGDNDNNGVQENVEAIANRYTLLSKKINIKPSIIKYNSSTNNIVNIDSALDQSDAEETDNAHDFLSDDDNNGTYELLIVAIQAKANGYTLSPKRRNVKPSIRKRSNNTNNVNIKSAAEQSDAGETDNAYDFLGDNDHTTQAKANRYTLRPKKKNVKPSIRRQNSNINNIESAIDQCNRATQAKANGYMLRPKKKNVKSPIRRHNTNNVNIESALGQSDADETNNSLIAYGQDNTDEIPHDSNTLTPAINAFSYTDLENITSQSDTLTLARNRLERKTRSPMCLHNTNIEDNNQDTTNIDADQVNKISANNVSPLKSVIRSSVQKRNDIKKTEYNAQNSGALNDISKNTEDKE
ncbi:3991_t:CDS:10 [Racocetra fulgida]|uniref:3991_t:CDS:1 n=1 Tax=Racocetra fulgida TaxID=60492 RepID=A0A9N8Z5K6_9GLOM|nr:3991_t:CDS:10 [Racocetra fulgida]